MNEASILIVDDESAILHMLTKVLGKEGFTDIDTAATAEEAFEACRRKPYALILLDVMLPGKSGFDICPLIRSITDAPVLFLTARGSDFDKLTGFALGGDDYITKPFNPLEVVARIKARLRRQVQPHVGKYRPNQDPLSAARESLSYPDLVPGERYDYGRFQLDALAGELIVEGRSHSCPAQVYQLLLFLCRNPNRIFSKQQLYEKVWGTDSLGDDNTVMVHVHRIRERIEKNPGEPKLLVTVRGLGYKLVRPAQQEEPDRGR
ncbi:response regulator transcription factor [Paenibacillus sp. FJAT-26967]|uniref:response regulator transcription factor n=1 Tax=Paenibacillus sp. FJAT-26967 TaxID=1729690 RepID=UPI0008385568|nr:response regulator transcription factor [Paenibacillus sp. FJAT-26967]